MRKSKSKSKSKSKRKRASFIIGFTIASVAIGCFSFVIIKPAPQPSAPAAVPTVEQGPDITVDDLPEWLQRNAIPMPASTDGKVNFLYRSEGRLYDLNVIDVTSRQIAYPLFPPVVMMGVETLSGSETVVNIGGSRLILRIGERYDISEAGRECFLTLIETKLEFARFAFACKRPLPTHSRPEAGPGMPI